jgi:hypothetical protein
MQRPVSHRGDWVAHTKRFTKSAVPSTEKSGAMAEEKKA